MKKIEGLISSNTINNILIDIDGTLYDYQYANKKALETCHKVFLKTINIDYSVKKFASIYKKSRQIITKKFNYNGTCRSRMFAFQLMFEDLGINKPHTLALEFEDIYWDSLLRNMKTNKPLLNLLRKCKKNGMKICAVTDMQSRFQILKIKKIKVNDLIDFLVTSEEHGKEKPDKAIYKAALKKLSCKPSEAMMIGDNKLKDVDTPESIGIKSVLIRYKYN